MVLLIIQVGTRETEALEGANATLVDVVDETR
jgi:hypothetical protein